MVTSLNFEFLRDRTPELADLAGFAERYASTDPAGALIKLRVFGENLVADFFTHYQVPQEPKSSFLDLLRAMDQQGLAPRVVLNKLHTLRQQGNQAAHSTGSQFNATTAMWVLNEAFDLAKWFAITVHGCEGIQDLDFRQPAPDSAKAELKREKRAALQKLAEQEAAMKKLLDDLEDARRKAAAAEKTKAETKAILARANEAVDVLHWDEEETRKRRIDDALARAGWNLDNSEEVGQEVPLTDPDGGKLRADYVLWNDDGKPLAVIEAKRTAHGAEKGRTQARLYADAIEREHGHRPTIFYTNGYDIHIWDDADANVPRRIWDFYNKESLQRLHWERDNRRDLTRLAPNDRIIDRPYQIEAVKQVCERFAAKRRKALIVLATGTGKTRVAIALADLMLRAHWARRVLFLCDRRELRKQARNAFEEHIPSENAIYVTGRTSRDRSKTIYLATYPAMMKCFQNFDVGFFDLVIADESHRSIYNRYRDLFEYFDAYQLGLTATPRHIITHNTYRMFDCEDGNPTAYFSYRDAIEHTPPYLAEFDVMAHSTRFLREGIRWADLTEEQKRELEDDVANAEDFDVDAKDIDKAVFNRDTDRRILRNLMDNGIRDATGQHVGKTIVFARSHDHAVTLCELFEEMYPQYNKPGREFCALIDNYVDKAEQLIDDFKGQGTNDNLTVAISVDMLDTGIDVPELVNLVFAKPVKSYVKFWQMIGRGTRICRNLFGPGQHKLRFAIFDHWGNFEYFGENPREVQPSISKGLLQRLFEARIDLAEAALEAQDLEAFETAVELIERDVRALPEDTIAVREKWRQVHGVLQSGVIKAWAPATVALLRGEIARLMQWRELDGHEDAYKLDLLVARLQRSQLRNDSEFENLRGDLLEQVSQLPVNLQQVQEKRRLIEALKKTGFWKLLEPVPAGEEMREPEEPYGEVVPGNTPVERLDSVRRELRGIMKCRNKPPAVTEEPLHIDVTDDGEQRHTPTVKLEGLDLVAYRDRVEKALRRVMDKSPVLQRIRAGRPVPDREIRPLITEVMASDPNLDLDGLLMQFPEADGRLDLAIRQVVGLDAEAVSRHFASFLQKHPDLTAHQMRFLDLLQKHIAEHGRLEIQTLYEDPFTRIHMHGIDGVFTDETAADELIGLIQELNGAAMAQ